MRLTRYANGHSSQGQLRSKPLETRYGSQHGGTQPFHAGPILSGLCGCDIPPGKSGIVGLPAKLLQRLIGDTKLMSDGMRLITPGAGKWHAAALYRQGSQGVPSGGYTCARTAAPLREGNHKGFERQNQDTNRQCNPQRAAIDGCCARCSMEL